MLNLMIMETVNTKGKLYGENPAADWVLEFRTRWDLFGGAELDGKVNEEYSRQAERIQRAMNEEYSRQAERIQRAIDIRIPEVDEQSLPWSVVPDESLTDIKPLTTPPPNSPSPSK